MAIAVKMPNLEMGTFKGKVMFFKICRVTVFVDGSLSQSTFVVFFLSVPAKNKGFYCFV